MDTRDRKLALVLVKNAATEAWRIEQKLSRYETNNPVARINASHGSPVEVDEEISHLLDYAQQCYELSEGLFDITSGVLRRAWHFDGSDNLPTHQAIDQLLPYIGWKKISWMRPWISVPTGMEIDLGGIGKEYAVDRTALILNKISDISFVVNYGGDIFVNHPRKDGRPWLIGVEHPRREAQPVQLIAMNKGGMATSGDAKRYLEKNGKRYCHVMNPFTGWSVEQAAHSITVVADSCTEAGVLATFGLLQGPRAEAFLEDQKIQYWCYH